MSHLEAARIMRAYLAQVPEHVRELGEAVADYVELSACDLPDRALAEAAYAYAEAASRYGQFDRADRVTATAAIRAAGL